VFRAVIFDMDGLLVDSEPFWRKAEVCIFSEQLGLTVSEAQCAETMGMRIDQVVARWAARSALSSPDCAAIVTAIVDQVCEYVRIDGKALPGVQQLIELLRRRGIPLAVASSSPQRLIDAVLHRLGLHSAITLSCSAEHEAKGKPDPAVFLTTARRLQVPPRECLVFEDSAVGISAAKSAGMCAVAVPGADQLDQLGFAAADRVLPSLEGFTGETLDALAADWFLQN
jgi:sugar-phosphatase